MLPIPESKWFHSICTIEYLHTADGPVVILVVQNDSLLHYNLFGRITDVNKTEHSVRDKHMFGWHK